MGGAHLGFNIQRDKWVYGLEGDIDAVEDTYDYLASVRGRLGLATDSVLLYGTAGVAFAESDRFDARVALTSGGSGGNGGDGGNGMLNFGGAGGAGGLGGIGGSATLAKSSDDTDIGFVIGTGTDVKLSERLSIGTEGLLYLFEEDKVTFFADGNRAGSLSIDNDIYVVRARLTYHLQ